MVRMSKPMRRMATSHRSSCSSSSSSSSSSRQKAIVFRGVLLRGILIVLAGVFMLPHEACFATSSKKGEPRLHLEDVDRVNVYVYDDPVFDHTALIQCYRDRHNGVAPWQDERKEMAQNMGEIWLHQSMLSHPWRVLDPADADVFFIPLYPVLGYQLLGKRGVCNGLTHQQGVTRSIMHLVKNSVYFNRFGGADHVVVCAWCGCGRALYPQHRMLLRRTVLGINEKLDFWSRWTCSERTVTVPYTASSVLTTPKAVGGLRPEEKDIPFMFVGTARGRPERENLAVVTKISPGSIIALGSDSKNWDQSPSVFANNMARSRFCFVPRGDTASSRRLFDAVSAGCIPILTSEEVRVFPFVQTGLNYSDFAVVAKKGSFGTIEQVTSIVKHLSTRSDEQLIPLREGLERTRSSLLYGVTAGTTLADMEPYHGTASMFLVEVRAFVNKVGLWHCSPFLSPERFFVERSEAEFPPPEGRRGQWLHESETIVNVEHSLLFCAPPNTGSLQFRMLAKRMKGVDHWSVSNAKSLVFDAAASQLPLLDVSNTRLMEQIYKLNNSGWIKIGVVRDPVTRLLSAYLDLVRSWPPERTAPSPHGHDPEHPHRGLRNADGWDWFDAIKRHRGKKRAGAEQELPEAGEDRMPPTWGEDGEEGGGLSGRRGGPRSLQDAAAPAVPTFEELLGLLAADVWAAPSAFRPAASLCGMWQSPFDTIIPFETLQDTSKKVLKSLPGDIWQSFGESGWGPQGKHAFMEFDYGTVTEQAAYADGVAVDNTLNEALGRGKSSPTVPPRARHLSSGGSCAWIAYYADHAMLDKVGRLYVEDYDTFGWYDLSLWHARLEVCLKGR